MAAAAQVCTRCPGRGAPLPPQQRLAAAPGMWRVVAGCLLSPTHGHVRHSVRQFPQVSSHIAWPHHCLKEKGCCAVCSCAPPLRCWHQRGGRQRQFPFIYYSALLPVQHSAGVWRASECFRGQSQTLCARGRIPALDAALEKCHPKPSYSRRSGASFAAQPEPVNSGPPDPAVTAPVFVHCPVRPADQQCGSSLKRAAAPS